MSEAALPDPSRCPLCGGGNGCAMEAERATGTKQPPCWCTRVEFNREVLLAIPPAARRRSCICEACATQPVGAK
ncbi:MAG: cysteine-rich CWC family protein [Burkholderiaceae bacterium]